jgi:hypothetical protein
MPGFGLQSAQGQLILVPIIGGYTMKYRPGESGNPSGLPNGRPKGSYGGRIMALQCLDKMLAKRKSQAALMRALEAELHANPLGFFRTIVMPLLPREAKLSLDHDGVLEWKSMLTVNSEPGNEGPASA